MIGKAVLSGGTPYDRAPALKRGCPMIGRAALTGCIR
jgi:hypothetical protein